MVVIRDPVWGPMARHRQNCCRVWGNSHFCGVVSQLKNILQHREDGTEALSLDFCRGEDWNSGKIMLVFGSLLVLGGDVKRWNRDVNYLSFQSLREASLKRKAKLAYEGPAPVLQAMEREEEQQREYEEFLEISRLQLSVSKNC